MSGRGGFARLRRAGLRAARTLVRRARKSHPLTLLMLLGVTVAISALSLFLPSLIPTAALTIPLLLGGLLLRFKPLVVLTFVALVLGSFVMSERAAGLPKVGLVVTLGVVGWIVLTGAKVRSRLGVQGSRGESMLIELRGMLTAQGVLPRLPSGWLADASIRSAGGQSFSGDFVVAAMRGEDQLEIALVDVSGKGIDAGTRALLLSGAFGGLLGVVPVEEFLPAANHYARRQEWDDDFATVVHVAIDLGTGEFEVRTAGHPPAIQFDSWSGRWTTRDADGPLLGLVETPEFAVNKGQLKLGDALLLYSDGMVETPRRDIGLGTDRLAGHAERLVAHGFEGAAEELVVEIGGPGDDSAIVVIHRRTHPSEVAADSCPGAGRNQPATRRRTATLRTGRSETPAL
ncbi:PP2C family protein-serine/threonine phosphatase [Kribbella italica]|uniref:PPM-type phosphatase domain-containing protein n=1 Tax=Kribbella italica TaxID=1540520 RepID=A0A7W9MRG9_9ACTN|nr:PP2C family protein-serine/threonine phosphatase [Kribbella italica]MBB5833519.1 hypothetical protein [Kribbella italica]